MMIELETLAAKARDNITQLFLLLGDAGTLERSHGIVPPTRNKTLTTEPTPDKDQRMAPKKSGVD